MKSRIFRRIAMLSLMFASLSAYADGDIVEHIEQGGVVTLDQPFQLRERLKFENGDHTVSDPKKMRTSNVGYRIQVYSDNNQATGKRNAQIKEQNIVARFPKYRTYLSYKAPMWRLRVGDFQTREEANKALSEMRSAMPAYSKDMTVVIDRINLKEIGNDSAGN